MYARFPDVAVVDFPTLALIFFVGSGFVAVWSRPLGVTAVAVLEISVWIFGLFGSGDEESAHFDYVKSDFGDHKGDSVLISSKSCLSEMP